MDLLGIEDKARVGGRVPSNGDVVLYSLDDSGSELDAKHAFKHDVEHNG